MLNTLLEAAGLLLIAAACACLVIVAWSLVWQAGAGVLAIELGIAGAVMVVVANRRTTKRVPA